MKGLTLLAFVAAICITDVFGLTGYVINPKNNKCWYAGGSKGGANTKACGAGGYCCRKGWKDCPKELADLAPGNHHTCVVALDGCRTAAPINPNANLCWGRGGGGLNEKTCGVGNYCCRKGWKDCPADINAKAPGNHHTCMRVSYGGCNGYCRTAAPINAKSNKCWYAGGSKGGLNEKTCGIGNYCCRKGFKDCPADISAKAPGNHHTCMRVSYGACLGLGLSTTTTYTTTTYVVYKKGDEKEAEDAVEAVEDEEVDDEEEPEEVEDEEEEEETVEDEEEPETVEDEEEPETVEDEEVTDEE